MLVLDFWFICIAGAATIFAAVSKAGFGSGASFAAASVLALVVEPGLALGVMLPILMLIDVAAVPAYWRKWDTKSALLLVVGSLPGVALGAWLYSISHTDVFRILIGLFSIFFVAWQVASARGWIAKTEKSLPTWAGALAGMTGGFTSFVSHAGGPPVAIYLLRQGLDKLTYQATTVLTFWAINIAKAVPYAFLGMFTLDTLKANLLLAPFALFGTWLGGKLHNLVPEKLFFRLTYVMLLVTGTKLIWDGIA